MNGAGQMIRVYDYLMDQIADVIPDCLSYRPQPSEDSPWDLLKTSLLWDIL